MPGVSSIVNSSIGFFDSAIAALALSASAPTVNSIFDVAVGELERQLLGRADGVRGVHDRAELDTAKNTTGHSGTFGDHSETTSPFLMPRAARPAAVWRICSSSEP